jgi:hypothetical protein
MSGLHFCRAEGKVGLHLRTGSGPASETEAPRISRQVAHDGGKVVSPTHRPPYPPEICPVLIYVTGRVDLMARIKSMKNPYDPMGN